MSNWSHCCAKSLPCRFEWQPAAQVTAGLLVLGLLAMLALLASAWPRPALNLAVCIAGLLAVMQALQWQRRAPLAFVVDRYQARASCDGIELEQLLLIQRCGVHVLRWRLAGRQRQCVFLPGQLPAAAISELHQWPRTPAPFHKGSGGGTIA